MKKFILSLFSLLLIFLIPKPLYSQTAYFPDSYVITSFDSEISLEKDTSLVIKEKISVNFPDYRHGIYRVIPVIYSANGKTVSSRLKVISISDENGNDYKYKVRRVRQSIELKIGDPDKTIYGKKTYLITYRVSGVLQRYDDHDEIYWNVTGSEWDTDILSSEARLDSQFAAIKNVDCFAGTFRSLEKSCESHFNEQSAQFSSLNRLGTGRDFTLVVALDKNNALVFPGILQKLTFLVLDNWGYLISFVPFLLMSIFWLKKGRDKKFAGENVYYKPDNAKIISKPLWGREHLPLVYHPIQNLSPSEVGTIVDQKIDIHDIVAEIVELARLGYLKIEKLTKDKLIGRETDYAFTRIEKDLGYLADYQIYLLEKLFDEDFEAKTITEIEKIYKKDPKKLKDALKMASLLNYVLLSSLKNRFYTNLAEFKEKLYASLDKDKIFDGKLDKVKTRWVTAFLLMEFASFFTLFKFSDMSGNFLPIIVLTILSVPSFILALSMPRRTAWGYSLYRQIKGLAFYLGKGKWREEIAEKRLFFEEMLPLAICLGIVDKLAREMQDLGVAAPSYISGVTTAGLYMDISGFESKAGSTLMSSPGGKWSGSSSWSGGSGFSGGFSGGGFGGGGGGSW